MTGPFTLAIDIGGSGLKAAVLDLDGKIVERRRVETPHPASVFAVLDALAEMARALPAYDRISVGFPGVVREGHVLTAANLDEPSWRGYDLAGAVAERLEKPARVVNDAEMQGLGAISGRGLEMMITLGTGFGSALFQDGVPAPHLELAHHPFRKGETYEEQLGERARKKVGGKKWNRRIQRAIVELRRLLSFDRLYIGGGNARKIDFRPTPDVQIVPNEAGLCGGAVLWRDHPSAEARSVVPHAQDDSPRSSELF